MNSNHKLLYIHFIFCIDFIFKKFKDSFEAKYEVKHFQNIEERYGDVGSYIILQVLMAYTSKKESLKIILSLQC